MEVTVYTRPGCQSCRLTIRQLTESQIPFATKPLDESVRKAAIEHNMIGAPVVRAGDQWWDGFRPDRIAALKP